jgi:hypothetical protein
VFQPGHGGPWSGTRHPSLAGCARLPGSTATPSRRACSSTPRPCTCDGLGWTTNRMRPRWTANEVGGMLVAAGLGHPREHALISLLAINGLRISEALSADIDKLGLERGHRTLTITRKGGKIVTIPLAPRTARAIDLAIGERLDGPIFLTDNGQRLDRHGAGRIVRRIARRAGITNQSDPTPCATRSPQPWTQASHCATSRRPPHTQTHGRQCATTEHASASTATPPTSSRPTSQEPPDNPSDAAGAQRRQHIAVVLRVAPCRPGRRMPRRTECQ